MNGVLVKMIKIYQPNGIDWMGYKMTPDNPYTYHHIKEKRIGGKVELRNGAILTRKAHEYLNYLEHYCPEAYDEFQDLFREINALDGPIPIELYERIYLLLYQIYIGDGFKETRHEECREEKHKERRESKAFVKRYVSHYNKK